MKSKYSKEILLMIYIFSFIFMLFGITFSYFSSRIRTENKALDTKSGHITLSLEIAKKYNSDKLIPTDDTDIMKAYHNECKDDNGRQACDAYDIIVSNDSERQLVNGIVDFDIDHIENLSYLVLDEEGKIYQNVTKIEKSTKNMPLGGEFVLEKSDIGTPTKRSFTLIIWLTNLEYNQVEDAGGKYSASITYNSIFGQKLSSTVSGIKEGGN